MPDDTYLPTEPILKTKLFIPAARAGSVARPHLVSRLAAGIQRPVTLLSAPAGFGKTTLLADWVQNCRFEILDCGLKSGEGVRNLKFCWFSLDEADNAPNRFLTYLAAALESALPGFGPATRTLLQSAQPAPLLLILATLVNEVSGLPGPCALVLDDYQFITNPAVHEGLAWLVEHQPPQLHLVIATRTDPPLPLARLRGRGQLVEIRMDDLRFTPQEAAEFLNGVMGLSLTAAEVEVLEARTEGWIAGLQLAALSLQNRQDAANFIQSFSGSHRYILEYLLEEVLDRQPAELQQFLLVTSVLERLCAPLCAAVIGSGEWRVERGQLGNPATGQPGGDLPGRPIPERPSPALHSGSSQSLLDHLERSNLFLIPLDDERHWYRYHHLFADLLRARLNQVYPGRATALHRSASRWFEAEGWEVEAINHALAAQDYDRAAGLVEKNATAFLTRGELAGLLSRIRALPDALVRKRPLLSLLYAEALTFSGQLEAVEQRIQDAEQGVGPGENSPAARELLGGAAAFRAVVADIRGDLHTAVALARRADELLPADSLITRSLIPYVLGDGYYAEGDLVRAAEAYTDILRIGRASGNLWTMSVARGKLANVQKILGQLSAAEAIYRDAVHTAEERGGQYFGTMGALYIGYADLLRERNELDLARRMLRSALDSMGQWTSPTDLANGYMGLARVELAQGNLDAASGLLQKADELVRGRGVFQVTAWTFDACRLRLWQRQGDRASIARWVEAQDPGLASSHSGTESGAFSRELEKLILARGLIAVGQAGQAESILARCAGEAEAGGRTGRLIEILALQALALAAQKQAGPARSVLQRCLALAQPEGYQRIFLDEGEGMRLLILDCRLRVEEPSLQGYADTLLSLFPVPAGARTESSDEQPTINHQKSTMTEPLTARELEVLRLICAGFSNQEIAEKLVISINTVKRHNNNLFAKLEAGNRAQAIVRAHQLGLLEDHPD